MLLFSIVVPNFNYGHFLTDCLHSLHAQSLDCGRFEVLVCDDGSTDDSLGIARRWGQAHPNMGLRLCPGPHAGHPGAVRNRGLHEARAPWLLCLDADDTLESGTLAALAQAVGSCEGVGSAGLVLAPDCVEARPGSAVPVPVPDFDADLVRRQHPCSSAVCYPAELWRAVGGYDTHNPYEDWDFLLRAVAQGAAWQRVPGAVHTHRIHGGSVSERAQLQDAQAKADMVLRSASFFAPQVVWWARHVRRGTPWVTPFPRGVIPGVDNLRQWHTSCVREMGTAVARFFPPRLFGDITP